MNRMTQFINCLIIGILLHSPFLSAQNEAVEVLYKKITQRDTSQIRFVFHRFGMMVQEETAKPDQPTHLLWRLLIEGQQRKGMYLISPEKKTFTKFSSGQYPYFPKPIKWIEGKDSTVLIYANKCRVVFPDSLHRTKPEGFDRLAEMIWPMLRNHLELAGYSLALTELPEEIHIGNKQQQSIAVEKYRLVHLQKKDVPAIWFMLQSDWTENKEYEHADPMQWPPSKN